MRQEIALLLIGAALFGSPIYSTAGDQTGPSSTPGVLREHATLVSRTSGEVTSVILKVWDPQPAREREFTWTPTDSQTLLDGNDGDGITGAGRLVWRAKGAADYDGKAVDTIYEGELVDGRPQGQGVETGADGSSYRGEWRAGQPEGQGELRLSNGDEYRGRFRASMFDGQGRYASTDGRVYSGQFAAGAFVGTPEALTIDRKTVAKNAPVDERHSVEHALEYVMKTAHRSPQGFDFRVYTDRQGYSTAADDTNFGYVTYDHQLADGKIQVMPANRGIMAAWKANGPIDPRAIDLYDLFIPLPILIIGDITNNSNSTARIERAFLDVSGSNSDFKPFPVVTAAMSVFFWDCADTADIAGKIIVDNYGWGPIEDAKTVLRFSGKNQVGRKESRSTEIDLKTFYDYQTIEVLPLLQRFGVDTTGIRGENVECPSTASIPRCIRDLAKTGIFGELTDYIYSDDRYAVADLAGVLHYQWTDSLANTHSQQSPYRVTIPLFAFKVPEPHECGDTAPNEYSGRSIELPADKRDYRISFDLPLGARVLKPRQNRRFGLVLDSRKSSMHRFKVVLQLSDGRRIESLPVDLNVFKFRDTKAFAENSYFRVRFFSYHE